MSNKKSLVVVSIVLAVAALAWIIVMGKVIMGALLFLASAGVFVRANATAGDNRLWTRPRVLVAGFVAVVAALTLIGVAPRVSESMRDLERSSARLVSVTKTIETMEYDAEGNVPTARRSEFEIALSESKYLPEEISSARENLLIAIGLCGGSTLALACCALVIGRARRVALANA